MTVGDVLRALSDDMPVAQTGTARALDRVCTGVTHDSRRVSPGSIFVALAGLRVDGLTFVPMAVAAGAGAVVSGVPTDLALDIPSVVVPDARAALARLAGAFFAHPSRELQVIGITGTNGKTTTAYLVRAILDAAGRNPGLMGTVAHHLGTRSFDATRTTPEAPELHAFMREMVSAGCRACVMEVSSHALALRRVDGIRFAAGVFTNLTRDHLDFHQSMDDYFAAKRRLFEQLPDDAPAVINVDDSRGALLVQRVRRPTTFAVQKDADVVPGPVSSSLDGLEFDVRLSRGTVHVRSKLVGRANVYNILAAVATTSALDVPLDAIEAGVAGLAGVPGRFEMVSSAHDDLTVIVDYAHTDEALRHLLETARAIGSGRIITVFGAAGDRDRTKRPLMGMVAARLSDVVVVTSDNPRSEDPDRIIDEVKRGAEPEARQRGAVLMTEPDRRKAIALVVALAQPGDLVLVAGKGHEKYQEVGTQRLSFDDVSVAREALDARRLKTRAG